MFRDCKLDAESIQCIADNINALKSQNKTGVIHIGHADDVPPSVL
jgi:Fe-S cluster assembly ATPase SufC